MEDKGIHSSTDYRDYVEEIDLQRYWLVMKRRWLPALTVFVAAVAAASYYGTTQKPSYEAKGTLLVQSSRSTDLTGVVGDFGKLQPLNPFAGDPLATQASIVSSLPVLEETIRTLKLKDDEGQPLSPDALKQELVVAPSAKADVIDLSFKSGDPIEAAKVVNQIMDSYVRFNIQMNRSEASAAREFVERQIPKAEADVERAAEALRQFKSKNQVVALEVETNATVEAVNNLNTQINTSRAQLADAETRVSGLRSQLGMSTEQALLLDKLSQSPGIQQTLTDLQTAQTELASERTRYTSNHPTVRTLERETEALEQLLSRRVADILDRQVRFQPDDLQMSALSRDLTAQLAKAEVDRVSTLNQIQTLAQARNAYIQRSQTYPTLEKQQLELEQRLDAAKTAYETLLTSFQQARLAENQTIGTAQIIESALIPTEASGQGLPLFVAAGMVAGGLAAVAAAFLLDLIDKSVKTVKDAEALLGYTLLGIIPRFSTPNDEPTSFKEGSGVERFSPRIVAMQGTQPFICGAYQMLQANLKFISSDKPLRSIVVTSSLEQEGKSELCANLAATMAQAGKQVLLVDADMRAPSQHHLWNVLNTVGLSHVLVGEGDLNRALIPIADNLTLLPAGVIPPNPLALIDSERMASLIATLSQQFDYVIFDTPPLVGAADSAVLGKLSDGILMMIRPRHVDSASVMAAKSLLNRSGAKILGFVANGVDVRNEHDDYASLTKTRVYGYGDKAIAGKALTSGI
ncbi:MAG TPA: polysaccharide biosynthesis tyrosine autokinase [Leptolyngbyaceae cyanobacterium]